MATIPLGYYVHHDGSGHMARSLSIISHISTPVVLFSTLKPTEPLPRHVTYIYLPDDAVKDYIQPAESPFLYTPYSPIILERYNILLAAIQKYKIEAMFVDVSPEIVLFSKLLGLRVGTTLMHGRRNDKAHSLAYDAADLLLSHNAKQFDTPINYHTQTPITYTGGISRLSKRSSHLNPSVQNILVVTSRATSSLKADKIIKTAERFRRLTWNVVGAIDAPHHTPPNITFHGVVDNVISFYDKADIVIGSGGNNTIMEIASQRKPFICIPDTKPYAEQSEAAQALVRLNAAIVETEWPSDDRLTRILDTYQLIDFQAFHALVDDTAPAKAAHAIQLLTTT